MFQHKSFQPASFSINSFKMAVEPDDSARSGYWRLFFTQMQEEALKADAKKPEAPVVKPDVIEKAVPKKRAKKPVKTRLEPAVEVAPIPFLRKPEVPVETGYDELGALKPLPDIMHQAFPLILVTQTAVIINLELERNKRRKQARRRAAAFLLLAA